MKWLELIGGLVVGGLILAGFVKVWVDHFRKTRGRGTRT